MPTRKKTRQRKAKIHNLIIKIPITAESLTAIMLILQELVALARVAKWPLQVEKGATTP